MIESKQKVFVEEVVHGSPERDVVSQLELLVKGTNKQYANIYNKISQKDQATSTHGPIV